MFHPFVTHPVPSTKVFKQLGCASLVWANASSGLGPSALFCKHMCLCMQGVRPQWATHLGTRAVPRSLFLG